MHRASHTVGTQYILSTYCWFRTGFQSLLCDWLSDAGPPPWSPWISYNIYEIKGMYQICSKDPSGSFWLFPSMQLHSALRSSNYILDPGPVTGIIEVNTAQFFCVGMKCFFEQRDKWRIIAQCERSRYRGLRTHSGVYNQTWNVSEEILAEMTAEVIPKGWVINNGKNPEKRSTGEGASYRAGPGKRQLALDRKEVFPRLSDFWAHAVPISHFPFLRAIVWYCHIKVLMCVPAPRSGKN